MRRRLTLLALLTGILLTASCSSDDDGTPFPSMWNEIATLITDGQGRVRRLVTDAGDTYEVTNTLQGYRPSASYRVMCGYSTQEQQATLYQAVGVYLLHDSTACVMHDPVGVLAAWKSGAYINLHLTPLTQGGNHTWGYATDSTSTSGHLYLSLHHRQGSDPLSYTRETYASLPLDSIKSLAEGDSVTLTVHTFKGIKTWNFTR